MTLPFRLPPQPLSDWEKFADVYFDRVQHSAAMRDMFVAPLWHVLLNSRMPAIGHALMEQLREFTSNIPSIEL